MYLAPTIDSKVMYSTVLYVLHCFETAMASDRNMGEVNARDPDTVLTLCSPGLDPTLSSGTVCNKAWASSTDER